jgi:hypothetical protein
VEYGLFSGFFMNKFACRKKMPIDIFLIFCHDISAPVIFCHADYSRSLSFISFSGCVALSSNPRKTAGKTPKCLIYFHCPTVTKKKPANLWDEKTIAFIILS